MSEAAAALERLIAIMAQLRDPQRGCAWDRVQSFASIAPYTLEEAYEVVDAIECGEPLRLRDELGDLLFQVVFHARMAEESGWFDFAQVAHGIGEKLTRRHPHVFGDAGGEGAVRASGSAALGELSREWELQKERERAHAARVRGEEPSVLADVPRALPALTRAVKLGKRAGRIGFDWPAAAAVREKVAEELAELDAAVAQHATGSTTPAVRTAADPDAVAEELGDLLFALANLARHLQLDPELALRAANAKFERRFRQMEQHARARGLDLQALSPAEWDQLWCESKLLERSLTERA